MKISVVVPTRNSARTITACLQSIRLQTHADVELIVVDNASTDGTADLAAAFADVVADRGPERCAQRNHGLRCSTGEAVVFIDSDMVLEPDVLAAVAATFDAEPATGALIIPERSFGTGFLAACRALEKSLYVGMADVEAPRAFRREVLSRIGGWDETLTAAEDWELSDRTRAAGLPVGRIDEWIWHDEGTISLRAQYRKKQYYGRWVAQYLDRAPAARSHVARPGLAAQAPRLLRSPVRTGGMVALKGVEAAGLLSGMRRERRGAAAGAV